LNSGVNRLRGEYVRSKQSLAARAKEASQNALLGYPANFSLEQIEKAAQLTPKDLLEVAKKYLEASQASTLLALP
ncbi:MAG: hypothetical protein IJS50_04985, partial [Desulfovibrio sp.]|nr:hypothetical protein [Desulfovibrio sp.]